MYEYKGQFWWVLKWPFKAKRTLAVSTHTGVYIYHTLQSLNRPWLWCTAFCYTTPSHLSHPHGCKIMLHITYCKVYDWISVASYFKYILPLTPNVYIFHLLQYTSDSDSQVSLTIYFTHTHTHTHTLVYKRKESVEYMMTIFLIKITEKGAWIMQRKANNSLSFSKVWDTITSWNDTWIHKCGQCEVCNHKQCNNTLVGWNPWMWYVVTASGNSIKL